MARALRGGRGALPHICIQYDFGLLGAFTEKID